MSTIDTTKPSRELDAEIAIRLFGWRWFKVPSRNRTGIWPPADGVWVRWNFPEHEAVDVTDATEKPERFRDWDRSCDLPPYSTDIAAAFAMEAEIERQGLAREYVRALSVIAGIANYANMYQRYWLLTHATACQRCAAALQVIDDPAAEISERKKGGCEPQQ